MTDAFIRPEDVTDADRLMVATVRIANLERERDEIKVLLDDLVRRTFPGEVDTADAALQMVRERDEWKAHAERLRNSIIVDMENCPLCCIEGDCGAEWEPEEKPCGHCVPLKEALTATPAQSLSALKAKHYEECAEIAEEWCTDCHCKDCGDEYALLQAHDKIRAAAAAHKKGE